MTLRATRHCPWSTLAWCVVLVVWTLWAYRDVRTHDFLLFDDNEYVTEHPVIRQGLHWDGVVYVFTQPHHATWHPLTGLSHLLDVTLFGLSAPAHLAVNVALHTGNAVLLFLLLARLLHSRLTSFWIAAAFALHPLHVESVAWVSERKDVLSTFFALLAAHSYVTAVRSPPQRRWWRATHVLFALALLAKPMVVTLPVLLLLLDDWPLQRVAAQGGVLARWWPRVREKSALFALALAVGLVTIAAQSHRGAMEPLAASPLPYRIGNAVVAYASYLRDLVWPLSLAVFYPRHPLDTLQLAVSLLVLAGITATAWFTRRTHPWGWVGWCWYIAAIAPVSGLLQVGDQARADRFTYLALVGVFLWIANEVREQTRAHTWAGMAAATAGLACLLWWGTRTARQTELWRNTETLFRHALAVTHNNHVAHANLGAYLLRQGRTEEALQHLQAAVALRPYDPLARLNLGVAAANRGDWEDAAAHYLALLAVNPDHVSANFNLALAWRQLGRHEEARRHVERALRADPHHAKAHVLRGDLLREEGDFAAALAAYRAAVAADPTLVAAHAQLAALLEALGQRDEALAHYRQAVHLAPNDPRAWFNLAAALHDAGDAEAARSAFTRALQVAEATGDHDVAMRARQALAQP